MKLNSRPFGVADDLAQFVNDNKILNSQIQVITVYDGYFVIFYWTK